MAKLKTFLQKAAAPVWHNCCRLCREPIGSEEEFFCSDCWSRLGGCVMDGFCPRCGRELGSFDKLSIGCGFCWNEEIHFDGIAAAAKYASPLSDMIIAFKLSGRTNLLEPLSSLAAGALERAEFLNETDFIVPVPLHWIRRFKRGFNQSFLIAKKISPIFADARLNTDLVRIKNTVRQSSLTMAARHKNLNGAFAVRKDNSFAGKNICLIDDIKTTGATLNECARTLKAAGAAKVFALTLAVAAQHS